MTRNRYPMHCAMILIVLLAASGCRMKLMPTPVLLLDPRLQHSADLVTPDEQSNKVRIFYATNRKPGGSMQNRKYTNDLSRLMRAGEAVVRLGNENLAWQELVEASTTSDRRHDITLNLTRVSEYTTLHTPPYSRHLSNEEQAWINAINLKLNASQQKDIFIYVHGFRVDFYHACAVTAEIHHFMGRQGVALAYAWPSRQTELHYILGDLDRAKASVTHFHRLVELLGRFTIARQINILSYSAGSPIVSQGLAELRTRYQSMSEYDLFRTFKIGHVIFTAADIDFEDFVKYDLKQMYDLPRRITVTIKEGDVALTVASLLHGHSRLGMPNLNELSSDERRKMNELEKLDLINVTYAQDQREFAIEGHGYWYLNPWMSSDIIAILTLNLPPDERGLAFNPDSRMWYIPQDYEQRAADAMVRSLQRRKAMQAKPAFNQ